MKNIEFGLLSSGSGYSGYSGISGYSGFSGYSGIDFGDIEGGYSFSIYGGTAPVDGGGSI